MKFTLDKSALANQIAAPSRCVNKGGGGLWVLTGLLIEAEQDGSLRVTGSNLDTWVRTEANADIDAPGKAVVPARLFTDIIRALPDGDVTLSLEESELVVTSEKSRFSLREFPVEDYPIMPDDDGATTTMPADAFLNAAKRVVIAASGDDARPILKGVLCRETEDGLLLVATDSYRLALCETAGINMQFVSDANEVIIPAEAISNIIQMFGDTEEIIVNLGNQYAIFEADTGDHRTRLMTRLVAGDFPNYGSLIPQDAGHHLSINRHDLSNSVSLLRLMSRETNAPVKFAAKEDMLDMETNPLDVGTGTDSLECLYTPDPAADTEDVALAFNGDYLLQGLRVMNSETITIERLDPGKPAVARGEDDPGFLYLLMPVRVS